MPRAALERGVSSDARRQDGPVPLAHLLGRRHLCLKPVWRLRVSTVALKHNNWHARKPTQLIDLPPIGSSGRIIGGPAISP